VKVQTCITSPPYYGLRDYGHSGQIGLEESPEEFIENLVDVFRHVREILADDGVIWVNIGDSYYNYRPGVGQRQGKQSIAGQKFSEVEKCHKRGLKLEGLKEKDLIGIPWMLAFALRADGWYLRQDIIWHKPNPMPESVRDRCTKAHEYIFLLSKSKNYYYDNEAIKYDATSTDNTDRNRDETRLNNTPGRTKMGGLKKNDYTKANKRSVWTVNTKPYKGAHFAVYPQELIEPCVLAGSREGDIVLDPFMGSGTTAAVAIKNRRQYLGCELNHDYQSLQQERITAEEKIIKEEDSQTTLEEFFN
jgi:DNA modification methylase